MKSKFLQLMLLCAILWYGTTALNPSNPPTGATGAPSETSCNRSGCHSGGTYVGTSTLTGIPDTVVAGKTYTITLTHKSNAVRSGFQMTCLDSKNAKCGTFVIGTGSVLANTTTRNYIGQSTPKNLAAGATSWTYSWKAPTTLTTDKLSFYFVTLAANGNGKESTDNSFTGSKTVYFKTATPTSEVQADQFVRCYPNPVVSDLNIDLIQGSTGEVSIYDFMGKKLSTTELLASNKLAMSHISAGRYIIDMTINGQHFSKRIVKL
jgi:hypothetical protein